MWPNCESLGEHGSDAFKAKWKSGPWGTLNVLSGQPNFIRSLVGSLCINILQCVGYKPEASKSCDLCEYHIILIGIRSRRQLFAAGLLWVRAEPISGPYGQYSNAKLDNHTLIYDSIGPMLSRLPMTNLRNGMNAQKSPTLDGLPQPRRTLK
jgi:hypothetical protein